MCPPMSASKLPAEVVNELLHAAADAAIVTDADGRILFANRGAETLFGYPAEELAEVLAIAIEWLKRPPLRDESANHSATTSTTH